MVQMGTTMETFATSAHKGHQLTNTFAVMAEVEAASFINLSKGQNRFDHKTGQV